MKYDKWNIMLIIVGSISLYLVLSGQMDGFGFVGIIFIGVGLYNLIKSN